MKKENINIVTILLCIVLIACLAFSVRHIYQLRHYIDRSVYKSLDGINDQLTALGEELKEMDADSITRPQFKELIDDFYYGCYSNAMAIKDFKRANKMYAEYDIFDVGLYSQWLKFEYADHEDKLTPAVRKKIFTSLSEICYAWDDCLAHSSPNYDFQSDPKNIAGKIEEVNNIASEYMDEL